MFAAIAGGGLAADLWTKSYMFARLGMPDHGRVWWVWPGVFGFQTSLNEGALFGIGQGWQAIFVVLALAALAAVLGWLFLFGGARDLWLCVALSGITAGVLGNLYDRLGLHGLVWPQWHPSSGTPVYAVRDFILVMIGPYHWPNFNIADSLLVGGAGLLIVHSLIGHSAEASPSGSSSEKAQEVSRRAGQSATSAATSVSDRDSQGPAASSRSEG